MALKNKVLFDIDTAETELESQASAISTLQSQASAAETHAGLTNNPHGVTAAQVGAATPQDVSNAVAAVVTALDWKEMVATFEDLATTYPEPEEGWTASVAADNITYRYDGSNWVGISANAIPVATTNNDGLFSAAGFDKLDGIEAGATQDQSAAEVPYNNEDSNLLATNVKGALDELDLKKLDATALSASLALYPTDTPADILSPAVRLVTSVEDPDYDATAVNISTPAITGTGQLVARLVADAGVLIGNPGFITVSTLGQIRKTVGNANQNAVFYYKIFRYDGNTQAVVTPAIAESDPTPVVTSATYEEFFAFALLKNGTFAANDRIVIEYYADVVENPGAVYQFQFGGDNPVRTLLPVPVSVIPAPDASLVVVDTTNFAGLLDGNDDTVQAALDTLDDHDHDGDYFTKEQLRPVTGDPAEDDFNTAAILDGRYILSNDSSILTSDDIGVNVQGYDANTVVDANYETFDSSGSYENLRAQATTKTDVDLGNVANYGIASQFEAQAGETNEKYMTPLRTKEAILELSPPTDLTGYATETYVGEQIDAAKLALGTNYSVANIAGRDALTGLTVGDIIFVADDGDNKWAQYKVVAVGDGSGSTSTYEKIMDEDIYLNAISASAIKTAYESNADTNAFTDALLGKLNGIEEGANFIEDAGGLAFEGSISNIQADNVQDAIDGAFSYANGLNGRVRLDQWNAGRFNGITWNEEGSPVQIEDIGDAIIGFDQRLDTLEAGGGGGGLELSNLTTTIPTDNWAPTPASTFVRTIDVGGQAGIAETDYEVNFIDNDVVENTFTNLPPQTMTLSSASTTGPVTLTKNGGGSFNNKFIGAVARIEDPVLNFGFIYVITAVIDDNNVTVYYQPGPNQGNTLSQLTFDHNQNNNEISFLFVFANGTGPNPEDPKVAQINSYEDQTQQIYGVANVLKGATFDKRGSIPAEATGISGLNAITNGIYDGDSYYAIILDNTAAYVSKGAGLRKIAKIEGGNTFINVAANYGEEDWSQAGGDLRFITPFAIEQGPNLVNAVTLADWANATVFPDISGVQEISISFALAATGPNTPARTQGVILEYSTLSGTPFTTADTLFLDLDITSENIGDITNIETAWSKIKASSQPNDGQITFVATEAPTTAIPIKIGVFK